MGPTNEMQAAQDTLHYLLHHADDNEHIDTGLHHHHGPNDDFLVCSIEHDEHTPRTYVVYNYTESDEYGPADHDH